MADLSDVEAALVTAASLALYPAGLDSPSVTGRLLRIYRGWPASGGLAIDLAAGVVNVTIFPVPDDTRVTTRWAVRDTVTAIVPQLTVTNDQQSATFGGVASIGQIAGVLVDDAGYAYRLQADDTPQLVAAALGGLIRKDRACSVSGATVLPPGAYRVVGRVAADAGVLSEWERQEQGFRLTVWAPDPRLRDAISSQLAQGLAQSSFLTLADSTTGRLRYRRTASHDEDQGGRLYRRDLVYSVEYATTIRAQLPSMLFGDVLINGATSIG